MKKKPGRKPIGAKPFSDRMLIECDAPQKRRWKSKAKSMKQSLSAWVRSVLDAASR